MFHNLVDQTDDRLQKNTQSHISSHQLLTQPCRSHKTWQISILSTLQRNNFDIFLMQHKTPYFSSRLQTWDNLNKAEKKSWHKIKSFLNFSKS